MRTLLLTNQPIDADQLRDAIGADGLDDEVVVVAPALHSSALRFWISDADEAIARADWVQRETVDRLDDGDVNATGDVGEADPTKAIEDVLRTFPADRILVFTRSGKSRYREDVDPRELERQFKVPVETARTPSPR